MDLLFVLNNAELELDAERQPPKEFRIFPFGEIESTKGKFIFDQQSAESVMERFKARGIDMSGDYEHAATQPTPPAEGAPSPLWCQLAVRADGLWAVAVKWTARAIDYLKNGEIRYTSPAFFANRETKRITRLHNIALTNDPATIDAEPLVAASALDRRSDLVTLSMSFDQVRDALALALPGKYPDQCPWVCDVYDDTVVFNLGQKLWQAPYLVDGSTAVIGDATEVQRTYTPIASSEGEMTMKSLLTTLGLKADATEGDALIALSTIQRERQESQKAATDLEAQLVTLTNTKSRSEAIGTLTAWKSSHDQVTALSTKVKDMEAAATLAEVSAIVEKAITDGKIAPAMKDLHTEMGKKDLVMLKALIAASAKQVVTPGDKKTPKGDDDNSIVVLSDTDRHMAKSLGLTEAQLLEQKKTNAGA